ncbi:hypothetical protein A7982_12711 [Minicystis rosea]|nr:hypothetical protein A7982_12711 [Minicystis rosea]
MDPLVLSLASLVLGMGVPLAVSFGIRRGMKRYLPDDTDLYAIVPVGKPFSLAIPSGPALDVMLRYRVTRLRHPGGPRLHGITVLVEATRELPERSFRENARPFELRYERLLGRAAKPIGEAPVAPGERDYAITRLGDDEVRTSMIARLPAGGPGVVQGRIELALPVNDLILFAKPS